MKKILTFISIIFTTLNCISQVEESSTRKFYNESEYTRINKDWTTIAEFKSGINEHVKFFPVELINLKTGERTKALQLDMFIKPGDTKTKYYKSCWVGIDEIADFINFIEKNVIPNLDLKFKDKSSNFIFKAKEMSLSYNVNEKNRRLTIKLNDYDNSEFKNYVFWTETQVSKIPSLLPVLKEINNNTPILP